MARQFYLIGAGRTRPAGRRSPPRARAQPRVQAYSSDFASESKPRVVDLDCAPHRIVKDLLGIVLVPGLGNNNAMSALEATAALAGIATVAGASSKQFIGGAVPKRMTRVADRSHTTARGAPRASTSPLPGPSPRGRGPGIAAARFAPTPQPRRLTRRTSTSPSTRSSRSSPRECPFGTLKNRPRGTEPGSSATPPPPTPTKTNEDALPPFQSVVESAYIAGAAEDATAEGGLTLNPKPGPPPLPTPPPRPSSVAYVASSPAYQSRLRRPRRFVRRVRWDTTPRRPPAGGDGDGVWGGCRRPAAFDVPRRGRRRVRRRQRGGGVSVGAHPVLQAVKGAADEIAGLAAAIREEVPDTLAAVRLSGLELTDCLEEVGELTHEVGSGVKSTGRAVTYTVDTAGALGQAAADGVKRVVPVVKEKATPVVQRVLERAPVAVEGVEARLEENASTEEYSGPVVVAAARAAKSGVQYARGALRAAGVAKKVGQAYKAVRDMNKAGADEVGRDERGPEGRGRLNECQYPKLFDRQRLRRYACDI